LHVPLLTKDFAKHVYAGKIHDHNDVGDKFPVVVITAIESKYHTIDIAGCFSNQEKHYTLHTSDGNDNIITIKIATQLNSHMDMVKIGSVLELMKFMRGFLP
jgi:hypothetical protein